MTLEVVPSEEIEVVIDFDEARARRTLREVDQALSKWITSTVQLADLVFRTQRDQCWRVDDDYLAAIASSAIALEANGNHAHTWLAWKFNRAARTVRQLADYGELRMILAADPDLPMLAEPELVARPMAQLLRPRYLPSETRNNEARDEAIRQVWRDALAMTDDGSPAAAITKIPRALKRSEFAPLKRLTSKSAGQRAKERQARINRARKTFSDSGYLLLKLGAIDEFDDIWAELATARKRWKPS